MFQRDYRVQFQSRHAQVMPVWRVGNFLTIPTGKAVARVSMDQSAQRALDMLDNARDIGQSKRFSETATALTAGLMQIYRMNDPAYVRDEAAQEKSEPIKEAVQALYHNGCDVFGDARMARIEQAIWRGYAYKWRHHNNMQSIDKRKPLWSPSPNRPEAKIVPLFPAPRPHTARQ